MHRRATALLATVVATVMLVGAPALADEGGAPHEGSCGFGEEFASNLRANDFDYEGEGIEPSPGAGEARDLHPTNCPGKD